MGLLDHAAAKPRYSLGPEARSFYLELHAAQSPLLNFEAGSIDRWLIVHGWLLEAGRVRD
jgi:hypothetical protein